VARPGDDARTPTGREITRPEVSFARTWRVRHRIPMAEPVCRWPRRSRRDEGGPRELLPSGGIHHTVRIRSPDASRVTGPPR